MKVIEKLDSILFNKKNGIIAFLFLLYFLTNKEINVWINNLFISKFNELPNNSLFLNSLFHILLVLIIFNTIKKNKEKLLLFCIQINNTNFSIYDILTVSL